ncbi:hypothetical protein ACO2RV_17185 [Ancylobacter sp. VNQ12]|uniref:hypothetical protein n=1 Tax=Ancylobacter sp. VNQ12 TaxID=3400920 RepID=UPI003C0BFA81
MLWVCLAARPDAYRVERIPTEARLPVECFGAANEWAVAHPSVIVRRFRCGPIEHAA